MKKIIIPVVIILALSFIIAGCSTGATSTTPATSAPKTSTTTVPPTTVVVPPTTTSASTPSVTNQPVVSTPTVASTSPATVARYGGTIKWIDPTAPGTPLGIPWLTPQVSGGMQLCLEPLFKELSDGTFLPYLAESYDLVSDPTNPSITFHLRKGVKYQDGTDFNAQSLKWNFDMLKKEGMFTGQRYWKTLTVVDDYTLRIDLTQWRNSQMPLFAANMVYNISPTAYQKNGADWARWNMVGTGPFTQSNFQRDVSLATTRNANYWAQGKPYLDGVTYLYVADELTRIALYKSGGADVLNCNASGRVASDLQAAGYKTISQTSGTSLLWMDTANADSPWSNLKVRQAAEYAIDKAGIAKTFGYGFLQPAYQLPVPSGTAYVSTIANRTYDVAKAKQLMTEAGYPNGFKTKLIAPNTTNKDIIVALQANFAAVGIQCTLDFPEASAYSAYATGTWNNALIYEANEPCAPNFNQTLGHYFSIPRAGYKSDKLPDGWLDLYNATMNSPTADVKLMQKCVQALCDDVSVIPLTYQKDIWAVNDKFQDTGMGTRGNSIYWNPENAWLSK